MREIEEIQDLLAAESYHQLLKVLLKCKRILCSDELNGRGLVYETSIFPLLNAATVLDDAANDLFFSGFLLQKILDPIRNWVELNGSHDCFEKTKNAILLISGKKITRLSFSPSQKESFMERFKVIFITPRCFNGFSINRNHILSRPLSWSEPLV